LGYGVWSLVVGLLVTRVISLGLAFIALRYKFQLYFSLKPHKHLLRFGSYYSANSFLEYFRANLDTITVGRHFSVELVGLYNKAYYLANLPTQLLISSITRVMFPVFSKLHSDQKQFNNNLLELLAIVGVSSMAICYGMIPAANQIVLVMLGQQWLGSVFVLQILLIAVPFDFMAHVFGVAIDSSGEPKRKTVLEFSTVVIFAISLIFLWRFGLPGIGLAVVLSSIIHLGLYVIQTNRIFIVPILKLIRVILGSGLTGAVVFIGVGLVSAILQHTPLAPIAVLILEIITGGLIVLLFLWINILGLLRFDEIAVLGEGLKKYVRTWTWWRNA
jgi:lipopolysaccharide exporter